jgi:Protein of unknown function (DUF992)
MNRKLWGLTPAAAVVVTGVSAEPAWSEQASGVKAGMLTCNVDSGWGFVFGSTRDLRCTYAVDKSGSAERYVGHISKFGVDIGYHAGGILAWAVIAPTTDIAKGALAGTYGGVTGGAAVGVGAGANVLVGGMQRSIALQPVSLEGTTGLNVAAGIGSMELKTATE